MAAGPTDRRETASQQNRRLLCLWLFAASVLAWVPGGFTRFVFAKLLLVAIACVLAATLPRQGRLPRSLVAALAVSAGVFVAASLVGGTPVASLLGRWPRYEGLPVLLVYAGSAWLGARVVGRGVARAVQLAHAIGGMALVLGALTVLESALDMSPLGESTLARSGSVLGNATDQGLVAMMAAIVVAAAWALRRDGFLVVALAAALATVALSGSRVALAGTALGLVALALAAHRRLVLPASIAVLAMLGVAALVPATRDRLLGLESLRGRLLQWDLTLDLVGDHPWLGVGPSRYVDAFGRYETAGWVEFTGPGTLADSPHNALLQAAVAGGLPLLVCLLLVAALAAIRGLAVVREHPEALGLLVAGAAYGLAMLANFTSAGPTCFAAFLIGALVATEPTPEPPWQRVSLVGVFGALAVVMFASCVAEVRLADGVDAARRGQTEDASREIGTAQGWRPLDAEVAMLGAQALAGTATGPAAQRAVDLADESLQRTPDSWSTLVAKGTAQNTLGDLTAARETLDRAVERFPMRPAAYVQRALARYGLGDEAGAREDLDRALDLDPDSRRIRRLLDALRGTGATAAGRTRGLFGTPR